MTTNAVRFSCHASVDHSPVPISWLGSHMSGVWKPGMAESQGCPVLVSVTGLAVSVRVESSRVGSGRVGSGLARSSLLNTLLHLSQPYFMLCHFRCIFFTLFYFAPPAILSCCAAFLCYVDEGFREAWSRRLSRSRSCSWSWCWSTIHMQNVHMLGL